VIAVHERFPCKELSPPTSMQSWPLPFPFEQPRHLGQDEESEVTPGTCYWPPSLHRLSETRSTSSGVAAIDGLLGMRPRC